MLKNTFLNAMVKAILNDQWPTINIKHPDSEEKKREWMYDNHE